MRYALIFSSSELFQHQIQRKNKINYTQILQKIPPPPPGGGYLTLVSKKPKLFMQITIGEMKKSAAGENFRNRNCFYTKNSAKMQKKWPTENLPPGGGERKCIYFGIPPAGGITEKSPPLGGIYPLLFWQIDGFKSKNWQKIVDGLV